MSNEAGSRSAGPQDPDSQQKGVNEQPTTPNREFDRFPQNDIRKSWNEEDLDEEHFISPVPGQSSWGSQSFDEDGLGSRASSARRKRFDSTTPTLIDEDDVPDLDEAHGDQLSSSFAALDLSGNPYGYTNRPVVFDTLNYPPHQQHQQQQRRFRPAHFSQQHVHQQSMGTAARSNQQQGTTPNNDFKHSGGVADPSGETGDHDRTSKGSAQGKPAANRGELTGNNSHTLQARGPFAFTPWAKNNQASTENRHGAFSPNILRLTEDIGNLLHEDEDDDYALEIPSVFRGADGEDSNVPVGMGGDWTGSYVFNGKTSNRGTRGGTVQRPSAAASREGRSRRRGQIQGNQGAPGGHGSTSTTAGGPSVFPPTNTVQPKPGRPGQEVFEFGKSGGNDQPTPQLINFGGAFVAPPKDMHGAFARPVASAPNAAFASRFGHPPPQHHQQSFQPHPIGQGSAPTVGMQPPAFDIYQAPPLVAPIPVQPASVPDSQSNFDVSSGGSKVPPPNNASSADSALQGREEIQEQAQGAKESKQQTAMHASATEFVPMSTTSGTNTPQTLVAQSQTQWQPPPISFGPPGLAEPPSWHSETPPPVPYQFGAGYNIAQPGFVDATGTTVSPSPHVQSWQPPPMGQPFFSVPPGLMDGPVQPGLVAPSPVSLNNFSAPSPDITQGSKSKKDPRKSRRERKKKPKAEKVSGPGISSRKTRDGSHGMDPGSDETGASLSEEPVDIKRAELEESPATRLAFKNFYRAFRVEERISFQKAEQLAQQALNDGSLPESVHWRVYLELADLAKRSNRYIEARRLYQKVCEIQPYASQGWLEYSKLEEDCGFMNRVSNILHAGLEYCEYSETLLTRAVKHQERLGNLESAREVLARLKHVGIDKVWRTVLEGALLEARAGNHEMARRVLKYLMHHVPWYGPLYLEAYKLERDQGHPLDAMHIVERGLTTLPRYGPLWFGAFRLYEEIDVAEGHFHLPRTMHMIDRAKSTISKELVWKLHLEAAQMLERTALAYVDGSGLDLDSYMSPVRRRLVLTILSCPQNLRWKVCLAAGRMELVVGNLEMAQLLFRRAHESVQQKSKSATLLDYSRLSEFHGDAELARAILAKARSFYGHDWKVWFESVLIEIRSDHPERAYELAASGLELHSGSGRLWATLVQLGQLVGGDETQTLALEKALRAVPKSGEVWCEGARIHLNPFSSTFDLHRSRRYLHFAARFTPQFGDSFIEAIRLEVLSQWLHPIAEFIWNKTRGTIDDSKDVVDKLGEYIAEVCVTIAVARNEKLDGVPDTRFREIVGTLRELLQAEKLRSSIDLTDLRLACTNADPNYGSLWFHCRKFPMCTPSKVIELAAEDVTDEIFKFASVYIAAMIRRMAIIAKGDEKIPDGADEAIETSDPAVIEWENSIDKKLRDVITLSEILDSMRSSHGLVLLESAMRGSIFITGLSELNSYKALDSMTLLERRRALFGTDALFP